jgi:type II secretion system protein H
MNGMAKNTGFTLIELMVAMLIIVVIMATAVPKFSRALTYVELRNSTQEIAAGLRQARNISIAESRIAEVVLDPEVQLMRTKDGGISYEWPDEVFVEVVNNTPTIGDSPPSIRFYPDGSATDSVLTVTARQRSYVITVDWLTGRVRVL